VEERRPAFRRSWEAKATSDKWMRHPPEPSHNAVSAFPRDFA
jgi:hypothetical protein